MLNRIDKLMPSTLKRGGISKQIKTALVADAVVACLQDRFGDTAKQMTVRRFKDGIAVIRCESSVLAEEIRLAEPELIDDINLKLETKEVERIVATS